MHPIELLGAGLALVGTVCAGTVVHELSHALALRASGVPYDLEWLPGADAGLAGACLHATWASVTPRSIPRGLAPWRLRVAAMAPMLLATPLALVPLGLLPDPFQTGDAILQAAAIGWLACALPSPRDFSLFSHAERAVAEYASPPGPE